MITQNQQDVIDGLSLAETEKKMVFVSTYYDGEDKEELLDALRKRKALLCASTNALLQFEESCADGDAGVA
jgi:hypothetical protein